MQILFVDDDAKNIFKAKEFCKTLHIKQENGMTGSDIKLIEKQIYAYTQKELLLKEKQSQNGKYHTPDSGKKHSKRTSNLDKYKIKSVPKWFEDSIKPKDETPIIEINDNADDQQNDILLPQTFTFGKI